MEQFDCGFDALQMFARLEGVNGATIVRGFCTMPEQRMGDLLPSSLWDTGPVKIGYKRESCLWQHHWRRARYPFINTATPLAASFYTSLFPSALILWRSPLPFISVIDITSTVSSLPSPSGFSDAKVGCRAWSGGLKCISCKFFLLRRVIGKKSRRIKLYRQPCTASIKSRNGSGRERNRKKGKNKQLGNGRTNHLATNNFLLCYMFTLSDASAKIARLFQEYTAHSWLWT